MYVDWRTDSLCRLMRGMTQKYLDMALGFPEKSADVRLAQVLDVSPQALDIPDIDSYIGLMHTLLPFRIFIA